LEKKVIPVALVVAEEIPSRNEAEWTASTTTERPRTRLPMAIPHAERAKRLKGLTLSAH